MSRVQLKQNKYTKIHALHKLNADPPTHWVMAPSASSIISHPVLLLKWTIIIFGVRNEELYLYARSKKVFLFCVADTKEWLLPGQKIEFLFLYSLWLEVFFTIKIDSEWEC